MDINKLKNNTKTLIIGYRTYSCTADASSISITNPITFNQIFGVQISVNQLSYATANNNTATHYYVNSQGLVNYVGTSYCQIARMIKNMKAYLIYIGY